MSTPFLMGFSAAFVSRLLARGQLEIAAGSEQRVVQRLAADLAGAREGSSLISSIERSLLADPEVEELYVDLMGLKKAVDALRSA